MAPGCAGEEQGDGHGGDAQQREHQFHGEGAAQCGVRARARAGEDPSGQHLERQQAEVLDPVDEGQSVPEHLVGHDLGHGRPEGGGHQRVAEAEQHHGQVAEEGDPLRREGQQQVRGERQHRSEHHPAGAPPLLVDQQAEQWGEDHGGERQHRDHPDGGLGRDAETRDQDGPGELLEGDDVMGWERR